MATTLDTVIIGSGQAGLALGHHTLFQPVQRVGRVVRAFLGLPWQRNRGSALVGFVGRDAERLAGRLGAQLRSAPPNCTSLLVGVGK
jgi:hypothetical protein